MVLATAQKTTDRPTANRGSGRRTATRWYRCQGWAWEPITGLDGTVTQQQVISGFNFEVEDTFMGLGTRDRLFAAAADRGLELIDFWPIRRPIAA